MNKKLKNTLVVVGGVVTTFILASCNSFCSASDTSNFRYIYDPINTTFYTSKEDAYNDILLDFRNATGLSEDVVNLDTISFVYGEKEDDVIKYSENQTEFEEKLFTTYNDNLISVNPGKIEVETKVNEDDLELTTYSGFVGLNELNVTLINNATTGNYVIPSYDFFKELDRLTLTKIVETANSDNTIVDQVINADFSNLTFDTLYGYSAEELRTYNSLENGDEKNELLETMQTEREEKSILANYGYVKHYSVTTDENGNETVDYYKNINDWNNEIANNLGSNTGMSVNFFNAYKSQLDARVANVRTCITVNDGFYGNLTTDPLNNTVKIEGKAEDFYQGWGDAFTQHGFLEGLLVYPIAVGVENLAHALGMNGWGQVGAVLIMTILVRALFMLVTLPSTISQQKMTYLQPELAKLQQKYPNAQTNQYDKERLTQAQMALYKKNKVHPFSMFIVMIIQFPLFICVWNALQGSASLSTDAVLGLNLSDSIWSTLTNFNGWPGFAGWWTALGLIILMSAAQIVSMLLPNILSKIRTKNIAKTVKSETAEKSQKTQKWVQWGMTIFIIIMGFSLPAAMGVYWFAGAIFSVIQTLIIHFVFMHKKGVKH